MVRDVVVGDLDPGVGKNKVTQALAGGTYVVQEDAADPAEGGAVDGGRGPAQEGPLLLAEVGDGRVRVVQEGDHHWVKRA